VAFDLQPEAVLLLLPHLEFLHQAAAFGLHFELLRVALSQACCQHLVAILPNWQVAQVQLLLHQLDGALQPLEACALCDHHLQQQRRTLSHQC